MSLLYRFSIKARPVISVVRMMSKERAGKSVKPGAALVLDGKAHRVIKITQGKRGKGIDIMMLFESFVYVILIWCDQVEGLSERH